MKVKKVKKPPVKLPREHWAAPTPPAPPPLKKKNLGSPQNRKKKNSPGLNKKKKVGGIKNFLGPKNGPPQEKRYHQIRKKKNPFWKSFFFGIKGFLGPPLLWQKAPKCFI